MFNPSTLSGALDIIIIVHEDGTLRSSSWHVRFGALGLLHHAGKIITITINGKRAPFTMFVDSAGRGSFFPTMSAASGTSDNSVEFPSMAAATVNIRPNDVRSFLRNNEDQQRRSGNGDFGCIMLLRDTAVDLEAALEFEEPDPPPVSSIRGSVDLAQSVDSAKIEVAKGTFNPVPSALVLEAIRPMLNNDVNTITFTVSSLLQGPKTASAKIFLWPASTQLVVSDVDGTVTTSDMLGHLLPPMGKDWTHPGLAELYSKIAMRGLQFVYLSSRPIGEAALTAKMLRKVNQDGNVLPYGPIITAPDPTFTAMKRELKRKPQEFKIPALTEIIELFKPNPSPFVFGFGNKMTDVISYKCVGLTEDQILLFNTKHRVMDASERPAFNSITDVTPRIDAILDGSLRIKDHSL